MDRRDYLEYGDLKYTLGPPEGELFCAVRSKDVDAVQQLIAEGADLSASNRQGCTALHVAAGTYAGPVVAALLAAGADVSARGTLHAEGCTPLLWMVKVVFEHTCRPRPRERLDDWPAVWHTTGASGYILPRCCRRCSNRADVVRQLVAAGAAVDAAHLENHRTPLHYAAAAGCTPLVAALLEAGADVGHTTPAGYTVLHAAASSRSLGVVQLVLSALGDKAAGVVRARGGELTWSVRSPPLHLAAEAMHLEVVEALVAAGADRDQPDSEGATALHRALIGGHHHLVPLLVTPGNVNQLYASKWRRDGARGISPLHMAVERPGQDDIESCTPQKRQLMLVAAKQAVAALLAAGADATQQYQGCTALAYAAGLGQPEVVQLLWEHVLQQHRQHANSPLVQVLQEAGAQALSLGRVLNCRLVLTLAADTLGEQCVHSLWGSLRQQLADSEQCIGAVSSGSGVSFEPKRGPHQLASAWGDCWAAAWDDLDHQRSGLTGRLQQLVISPHHHHQQQGGWAEAGRAHKRPRLTRELQHILEQQQRLDAGHAAAPAVGGSSRASRAEARGRAAVANQYKKVEAAAARGSEQEVQAVLGQLQERAAGLLAAAAAAGRAGHWPLFSTLLRQLLVLEGAQAKDARLILGPAPGGMGILSQNPQQQRMQQQGPPPQLQLDAALALGDALLANWLTLRRQQAQERREAVVAAVQAATAAGASSHS